jgi:hypothetical protein
MIIHFKEAFEAVSSRLWEEKILLERPWSVPNMVKSNSSSKLSPMISSKDGKLVSQPTVGSADGL